jgi:hypothetical protein
LLLLAATAIFTGCEKTGDNSLAAVSPQGKSGSTARFTIAGQYLYTVNKTRLSTFNISNRANPVLENEQEVGFEIETIFPFGDKLFIGSTSVVHIFSLQNPAQPLKLSEAISPTVMRRCDPVVAKDSVAYATLRSNAECGGVQSILAVYDIKNILKPVERMRIPMAAPLGLGYADTVLYVCDVSGLEIFNIKNAFQPVFIGSISAVHGQFLDVIPYGNLLFCWTLNGSVLFDISNPAKPKQLSTI